MRKADFAKFPTLFSNQKRRLPGRKKVFGLGIDIVSRKRIQKFLASHSTGAYRRLLSDSERQMFSKQRIPVTELAKLFAAKEAVFKASGQNWFDRDDFRNIEVRPLSGRQFRVKYKISGRKTILGGDGVFISKGKMVVAQVVLWKGRCDALAGS